MAEELQQSNQQRLHHFITESKWRFESVMDAVTLSFSDHLQRLDFQDDICLIIDETGNPKKGRHSASVKRQYCGQSGKIDNCQVGVYGALSAGSLVNLVQATLSGKEDNITKIEQARVINNHLTSVLKVSVKWVCFDAFYGRDALLLAHLVKQGLHFVADVPENLQLMVGTLSDACPKKNPRYKGEENPRLPFLTELLC